MFDDAALFGPRLSGEGPPDWTTCTELQPDPVLIHDTNCYYRDLGFRWPFRGITKLALRKAFQARNGGESPRLTYCLKRLLNAEFRRSYDRRAFGEVEIDEWLFYRLEAAAAAEASKRNARHFLDHGQVEMTDVLDEWEIAYDHRGEEVSEGPATVTSTDWRWGYFLLDAHLIPNLDHLRRWQEMLIRRVNAVGGRALLAIGYMGGTGWEIQRMGPAYVIFLGEWRAPSEGLAAMVVARLMMMIESDELVGSIR